MIPHRVLTLAPQLARLDIFSVLGKKMLATVICILGLMLGWAIYGSDGVGGAGAGQSSMTC